MQPRASLLVLLLSTLGSRLLSCLSDAASVLATFSADKLTEMSAFNSAANFAYEQNPAMLHGTGLIPVDASSLEEVMQVYQTNTAARVNGLGEPSSYNGQDVLFDLRIPAQSRVLFDKSYIKVTGYAANMAIAANSPVLYGSSIPWNPIAALFSTAEVQLNQNATTTEQINQNLGDASMVKMLTRYTGTAIEAMDDSFFTPCIETARDQTNGVIQVPPLPVISYLSTESKDRRERWLVNMPGNTQQVHSKNIYLSDLFDSLRLPAAFYLQNLQIKVRPKESTEILIKDTGALGVAAPLQKYFIVAMTLNLAILNLTESELVREKNRILANEAVLRESFYTYDAIQKTHSQSASYRDSNVKNMQAAVFMFPSKGAADGLGANQYQYCYGSGAGGASGLASYQMKYDATFSPGQPLAVTSVYQSTNSDVYAQYRLLCRKMSDREIIPALQFKHFCAPSGTPDDNTPYVLFCAQFYPQNAYLHKNMLGADHMINTSGGGVEPIVIVRIRVSFLEIKGDTSVYMIN